MVRVLLLIAPMDSCTVDEQIVARALTAVNIAPPFCGVMDAQEGVPTTHPVCTPQEV
jgi:hypothetical protein